MKTSKLIAMLVLISGIALGIFALTDNAYASDCTECMNECDVQNSVDLWLCENSGGPCSPDPTEPDCMLCRMQAFEDWFNCLDVCFQTACAV